jgi:hypothetical protein
MGSRNHSRSGNRDCEESIRLGWIDEQRTKLEFGAPCEEKVRERGKAKAGGPATGARGPGARARTYIWPGNHSHGVVFSCL